MSRVGWTRLGAETEIRPVRLCRNCPVTRPHAYLSDSGSIVRSVVRRLGTDFVEFHEPFPQAIDFISVDCSKHIRLAGVDGRSQVCAFGAVTHNCSPARCSRASLNLRCPSLRCFVLVVTVTIEVVLFCARSLSRMGHESRGPRDNYISRDLELEREGIAKTAIGDNAHSSRSHKLANRIASAWLNFLLLGAQYLYTKMSGLQDIAIQAAETLQTAHINQRPSIEHDLAPSTAADSKAPVRIDIDPSLEVQSDVDDDEVPLSVLQPIPRRPQMPPLPDLRFEQSYLASIKNAQNWQMVAYITVRDQVSAV